MSNKVTNLYIDTTGFCDDAMVRVNKALDAIAKYNGVEYICPSTVARISGRNVAYFNREGAWCYAGTGSYLLDGKRSVGLWELESIALRCKQEKKEEQLPTRNIYIDARKLDQEDRLNAYQAIRDVADGSMTGWLPNYFADSGFHHEALILFDIFAIDDDGDRRFYSEEYSQDVGERLAGAKELTFDQLMSLAR